VIDFTVEEMRTNDWKQVRSIYLEGIATGNATFEIDAPTYEKWDARHLRDCRLVARSGEEIIGWAALSPVSSRGVYAGVAEVSVCVREKSKRHGVVALCSVRSSKHQREAASGRFRLASWQRTRQASSYMRSAVFALWVSANG